jgi:hypothetical protein
LSGGKALLRAGNIVQVAQTRLKKRSHRPDVEACNDPPHNRLVDEVSVIMDSILLLDQKITQAEVSFSFSIMRKVPFHVS